MKFKIAISNTVTFQVVGKLTEGVGVFKAFNFSLTCNRVAQELISEWIDDSKKSVSEIIREVTTGWHGQRLVMCEDDTPADFSPEALDAMLNIAGMPMYLYKSYLEAITAKAKN